MNETEVITVKPTMFSEGMDIVELIRDGKLVKVDLTTASDTIKLRIFDFLTGAVFIVGGQMKNVGDRKYLFALKSVQLPDEYELPMPKINRDSVARCKVRILQPKNLADAVLTSEYLRGQQVIVLELEAVPKETRKEILQVYMDIAKTADRTMRQPSEWSYVFVPKGIVYNEQIKQKQPTIQHGKQEELL